MINQDSIAAVQKAYFLENECRPLYESYCFSQIPGTIEKLLTGESFHFLPEDTFGAGTIYDTVIVLFVDGFGWTFFDKFRQQSTFLKRFESEGIASKITSLFPSTTAAHVTLMNTGLDAGQTGIYEWFIYEPKLNRVIAPLPFSFAGDHKPESLKTEIAGSDVFMFPTTYQSFCEKNIESFVFQHESIAQSTYSNWMHRGATVVPYTHFEQALEAIAEKAKEPKERPMYIFAYDGEIDAVGHRKGIHGVEFQQTISKVFTQIEEKLIANLRKTKKKIALIVTADHGMMHVDPQTTYYLNREIPSLAKYIKKGANGKPLTPAGSCRDFFLHIADEKLHEVKEILSRFLKDKASIYLTQELIEQGLFSRYPVSHYFLNRVGNLVILPKAEEAVWWFEKNRFVQNFHAAHGGLTRQEMETIFLFFPFNA